MRKRVLYMEATQNIHVTSTPSISKPPNSNQLYSTPPSAKHLQYNKVPKTKNEIMGTRNFSSPPHRQPASKHMILNIRQFISEKMSRGREEEGKFQDPRLKWII
jgi:hypothetical protein